MIGDVKKRFWTEVEASPAEQGFAIHLDGRALRTPARTVLHVPTAALAERICDEWRAVGEEIDPLAMPFTRLSNAALDKVVAQHGEIVEMLASYGETDLLCHRAEGPDGLVARQTAAWDPVLDWAARTHGMRFEIVAGVLPGRQPPDSIAALSGWLAAQDPFSLMALHDLISISGSILLARAVEGGFLSAPAAWEASRIDETWQAEQWGTDSMAVQAARAKEAEFLRAADMLRMIRE